MRPQPLICCRDVEASSRWYCQLLGCRSAHGGTVYERLVDPKRQHTDYGAEGLILQLHHFDVEHDHGRIGDPDDKPYGNGVLLWFEVDDFDAAVARAVALGAEVVMPVHRNPPEGPGGPAHRELWIKDLDGYVVVVASPDGEAA
jgi:catechol 2,3-dioxygenase-like lactoylglutathione lyase family enzyme